MNLFGRVFHRSRQRSAARRVALDPSVQNYLALAHESVVSGESSRVEAICHEALDLHPESSELIQMARRACVNSKRICCWRLDRPFGVS